MKKMLKSIYDVLLLTGFENTTILNVSYNEDKILLQLQLPPNKEIADLENILPNLKQELSAHDFKIKSTAGKRIEIHFGKHNLTEIPFIPTYIHTNTLKIELPSAYGSSYLDFADGASCHLLNGGTTRMGKTCLLLYMSTVLYLQTSGSIQLYITSTKLKDFYSFKNVENVQLSRTEGELMQVLLHLQSEYKYRDSILYSPKLAKATDAKSVRKHYPEQYKHFQPIFLIIDEYARFADNKEIQKLVQELVETAGYVNIHIIISTQRPDARTVLPPRIKGNLLARICFTTTDRNNSIVILDQEGAERLGKIPGRAIFLDSDTNIIQVPYLSPEVSSELLNPYRKEVSHDGTCDQKDEGCSNYALADKIQDLFEEPTGFDDIQAQFQSGECMQSNNEATNNGWFRLAGPTLKG